MFRSFLVLSAMVMGLTLTACDNKEISEIAEAQHCLDKATPATAQSCLDKISGQSPQAFMMRCSAMFIREGFTTDRFVDAFEKISEDKGGSGGTVTAFAIFSFSDTDAMKETNTFCTKSGSLGMIQLASIADLATFVVRDLVGLTPQELEDLYSEENGINDTALADLKNNLQINDTGDEELGKKAQQLSEIMCSAGKEGTKLCEDLDKAINDLDNLPANPTPEDINKAIGEKLREQLLK